jgi:molecular chaperone Hsp33
MGAVLLASEGQDGEWVQLQLRGDGPLGTVTVSANSEGRVRGFAAHPQADLPPTGNRFDVPGLLGLGALHVDRNHASWKQPYSGIVPMASGEIAQDLALYLLESEQKPSAVALGVFLGSGGEVEAAGGYLVQSLPEAPPEALRRVETHVSSLLDVSVRLHDGVTAQQLLDELLEGIHHRVPTRSHPRFVCPCSRARVLRAATLLGRAEVRDIVEKGEILEVRCEFCAEVYRLHPDALGACFPDS